MSGTPSSTSELLDSVSRSLNTPIPPHDSQAQLRVRVFRAKDIPLRQDQTPPRAYAVIEYGKEKYKTGVVSSSSPEWREECIFSLKPGYMNVLVHVFDKEEDTSRPLGYVALQLVDIKLAAQSQRQWSVLTPGKYSKTKPSSIAIDAPKANTIKISVEACFIGETLPLWLQNGANRASTQRKIIANDKRISGDSAYISDSARTSTITNTTATSPDRLEMPMITLESYNTPNSARSSMDNVSMEAYSNPATPKQARRFVSRQMVRSKLANSAATDASSIGDLSSMESVIPRALSGNSLSLLSLRDNPSITHIAPTCGLAYEESAISVFGMRLGESLDDIETITLMGINVSHSTTWHNSSHVSFKAPPVEHLLLDTILKDNMNTLKHVRYIKFEVPVIITSKQYGLSNENVCFTYEMNLSRLLSPQNSEMKVSRIQRSGTAPRYKQNSLTVRSNEDVSLSSPNISHAKRSPLSFQHVPASSEQSIASDAGEVDSKASLSDDNEAQLYKKLLLEKQQELTSLKLYLDKVLAKVIETDPNILEQISLFEVNENDVSNGLVAGTNRSGLSQTSPKRLRLDEQDNEATRKQLKEYYAKIKSLEKAVEAEKDRAKKFQVKLTAKTSLLAQAQEDISTLNETNEKHTKIFDIAKRSFQKDIANLTNEREDLKASIENKNETIKKITDQLNGIIKEKTAAAETLKYEAEKLKGSDSVKVQMEKQIEELREDNQALNDERNDLVNSLSELQDKLKSTEEDMSLFETELKEKTIEFDKAKEYSPRIKSYEQKTDGLRPQLEELKEEKIALKQETRTLNEEKLTWMQLVSKYVEHEEIIASLNNELNTMRTASIKMQEKKNDPEMQAKLQEADKTISELQARLVELEQLQGKLKEAQATIENLEASTAQYEEIIKAGTKRLNETESNLESAETKNVELIRSLEDVQGLLDHLKNSEIKSLNEKLASIESDKEEVESKMVELAMDQEQALVKIKEYETMLENSNDMKYKEEDISSFKKKEESLLKKICALEADLITVSSKEAELQTSLVESKQNYESSQSTLKKLESDLAESIEREKQNLEKLSTFETEKETLTHNIKTFEADVVKLKEELEQKNNEYEELEKSKDSAISDLQESIASLKDDLNNARKDFETLQKNSQQEFTTEIETLNTTIKSLNENIEQIQKSKEEVEMELQKAQSELEETKKSLEHSKTQLEESILSQQKSLKEKKDEMEKLLFKNTELSSKVQEWESKEQEFASEKSSLTAKIATINAEFQRFKEEMESMRAKHEQELAARKSSVGVNFDMIKTNELLQKENEELIRQIEDLASKNSDYENMQDKCLLLSHEKEETQSKIERLERRIQQLKSAGNTSIDSVRKDTADKNEDRTPTQVEEKSTALTIVGDSASDVEILEVRRSPRGLGSSANAQAPRTKRLEDIKECKQQ